MNRILVTTYLKKDDRIAGVMDAEYAMTNAWREQGIISNSKLHLFQHHPVKARANPFQYFCHRCTDKIIICASVAIFLQTNSIQTPELKQVLHLSFA